LQIACKQEKKKDWLVLQYIENIVVGENPDDILIKE